MCVCVQYDIYSDQKRLKEVWFDSEGLYALVVTSALPPTERERVEAKKRDFSQNMQRGNSSAILGRHSGRQK